MNTGGEAAEQIVRMSLEGFEVAAKITGAGAKNIAILLYSILKEEKKTKGKARLTNMLRSGKELKVFTVKRGDLQKFTQEAKKYGVLYCVLADRKNKDPNAEVDVIARAEDASKISRIVERFSLASVDTASIVTTAEKSRDAKDGQPEPEITTPEKAEKDNLARVVPLVFGYHHLVPCGGRVAVHAADKKPLLGLVLVSSIFHDIHHRLQIAFAVFGVGGLFWVFGIVDGVVEPAFHIPYLADRHQPVCFLGSR